MGKRNIKLNPIFHPSCLSQRPTRAVPEQFPKTRPLIPLNDVIYWFDFLHFL